MDPEVNDMAEHEPSIGQSDDWYTPREIFASLKLEFGLDPCSPGPGHWVPAREVYTKADDGLSKPWAGLVFMNPPFGGRYGHVPWLERFFDHGNGIAIVRAYTSSSWWHDLMPLAEGILFPRGKTKFIRPDGSIGKAPGHGVVLVGMGIEACTALKQSRLGMYWDRVRDIEEIAVTSGPPISMQEVAAIFARCEAQGAEIKTSRSLRKRSA